MADTPAMTRRILATAALVVALTGSALTAAPVSAAPNPTLVITQTPAQVRLVPGETFAITLQTNVTTGYQWNAAAVGKKGVLTVADGVYTAPSSPDGMVGAPGTTTWTVTANKVGTNVVQIVSTPPGGGDGTIQTVTVIVKKC